MKDAQNGIKMAIIPIPHYQPTPWTTLSTMKTETQGVMRKVKKETPIARPRHFAEEMSEIIMSFMMLVPDWPTQ